MANEPRIRVRRGNKSSVPTSGMLPGDLLVAKDQGEMFMATDSVSKVAIVPPVSDLNTLPAFDPANDLMLVWDASETSTIKAKKTTLAALKTSFNIPAASTDEKVAVVAGGTSGYIYGTDGTNGVVRTGPSIKMTKDSSNGFVTLAVDIIDCGDWDNA